MENLDQVLDTPVSTEKRLQYAGFWIRFVAYIVDSVILWAVGFVLGLLAAGTDAASVGLTLLSAFIGVIYFAAMESSERQATLGKMAVGIKVGDRNGERISFANALGRYFAKILSTLIIFIGFIMAGWDEKNQALHDKIADTYVFYS
jgi:uncharacterized RDD family membrane protein YckC